MYKRRTLYCHWRQFPTVHLFDEWGGEGGQNRQHKMSCLYSVYDSNLLLAISNIPKQYFPWILFVVYLGSTTCFASCSPPELDLLGKRGLSVRRRAGGEIWRTMTCWAVWVWKEWRHVRDGSQQQWAVLGAFFMGGQGDNHIILVPHVESIMGKWMDWRKMAGSNVLQVGVLVLIFISSWT